MEGLKKIQVFALGGTIAMGPAELTGSGVTPSLSGEQLLAAVPTLSKVAQVSAETLLIIGSANLTFGNIRLLVQHIEAAVAGGADGIVVTQGTDTLEETAFLLSLVCDFGVPVIVTGAMRHPGQPGSDGPANLFAAVTVAASTWAAGSGVYIVMNDQVLDPVYSRKRHTSSVAAFEAENGPLAVVVEEGVRGLSPGRHTKRLNPDRLDAPARVALISAAYSDDALMLDLLTPDKVDGLVVEAFGGGHLPESWVDGVQKLARLMPVVLTSRVGGGPLLTSTYGYKGAEIDLIQRGLIPSGWLDARKARLLLALTARGGHAAIDDYFGEFRQ